MPARIIHGEALWRSKKIASLPAWAKPEYTWVYGLAGANGVFEFNPREIWARCYAFNRLDFAPDRVEELFQTFQEAKLAFIWQEGDRTLAFWTGSNKPGRRPRPSDIAREAAAGRLLPDPPATELAAFLGEPAPQPCAQGGGSRGQSRSFAGLALRLTAEEVDALQSEFPGVALEQRLFDVDADLFSLGRQNRPENLYAFACEWLRRKGQGSRSHAGHSKDQ